MLWNSFGWLMKAKQGGTRLDFLALPLRGSVTCNPE